MPKAFEWRFAEGAEKEENREKAEKGGEKKRHSKAWAAFFRGILLLLGAGF